MHASDFVIKDFVIGKRRYLCWTLRISKYKTTKCDWHGGGKGSLPELRTRKKGPRTRTRTHSLLLCAQKTWVFCRTPGTLLGRASLGRVVVLHYFGGGRGQHRVSSSLHPQDRKKGFLEEAISVSEGQSSGTEGATVATYPRPQMFPALVLCLSLEASSPRGRLGVWERQRGWGKNALSLRPTPFSGRQRADLGTRGLLLFPRGRPERTGAGFWMGSLGAGCRQGSREETAAIWRNGRNAGDGGGQAVSWDKSGASAACCAGLHVFLHAGKPLRNAKASRPGRSQPDPRPHCHHPCPTSQPRPELVWAAPNLPSSGHWSPTPPDSILGLRPLIYAHFLGDCELIIANTCTRRIPQIYFQLGPWL